MIPLGVDPSIGLSLDRRLQRDGLEDLVSIVSHIVDVDLCWGTCDGLHNNNVWPNLDRSLRKHDLEALLRDFYGTHVGQSWYRHLQRNHVVARAK